MKRHAFSIEIKATRETVWDTLWKDATFRDWASLIDEGTYMIGELKEGNKIQFISSSSGYGVTSLVDKLSPNEYVLFKHVADTKENGNEEREDEWTGGEESYSLKEEDGITTLTLTVYIPPEQEALFNVRMPQALERIKVLAEKKK